MANTEMHYVVFGKGDTPLLIIPGLGDGIKNVGRSSRALAFFYRKYAQKYRVYICSRKNQISNNYTTRNMAHDLAEFMEAKKITPAHVMGISMGGMIVQHLAAIYPNYVKKLIIAVSSSMPNKISNNVIGEWIKMAEEGRYADFNISSIKKTYSDRNLWKYRPLYPILRWTGKPRNIQHFLVQANACLNHNAHKQLTFINCPTLVIGGEQDRVLGGQASRLIAKQILGSNLKMYSDFGHGAFKESKQFDDDVMDFLIG